MTDEQSNTSRGLLGSLSLFANTLVSMAHTRLELLSVDLEEDRRRLILIIILYLIAFFFLMVGMLLLTMLIVIAFWDTHRLLVLGLLSATYIIASMIALVFARREWALKPKLFSASLLELLKDKQALS